MPVRACKRKARLRSAECSNDSPYSSCQRFDTQMVGLTYEHVAEITQKIENKLAEKMKDEIKNRKILSQVP